MNNDGTVASEQKISDTAGNFGGALDNGDIFGGSVASIGDLDGDGVPDLAVGAQLDDDGGTNSARGAVWILFMNSDGTVASHEKISDTAGNFGGALDNGDIFGGSVASIGDLDGDGVPDLAVGAQLDDDGGTNSARGAVWILFMNSDGTVASHEKISDTAGNFGGALDNGDIFGGSVASIGDLDGDGVPDLAVGAQLDDDGGTNSARGAVWILFMNSDGTVASHEKISDTAGNFGGDLDILDRFGTSVAVIGDLDGDGVPDLAVGAQGDDDGGTTNSSDRGAVWILFMDEFLLAEHDDNLTARADDIDAGIAAIEAKLDARLDEAISSRASTGDAAAIEAKLDARLDEAISSRASSGDLSDHDADIKQAILDHINQSQGISGDFAALVQNVIELKRVHLQVIEVKEKKRYLLVATEVGLPVDVSLLPVGGVRVSDLKGNPISLVDVTSNAVGTNVTGTGILDVQINLPDNLEEDAKLFEFQVVHDHGGGLLHFGTIAVHRGAGDDDDN